MLIDRRAFLALSAAITGAPTSAFEGRVWGRIETLAPLGLGPRSGQRARVFLPPLYDETERLHQTLYMLDGQFAFAADSDGVNFATDRRIVKLMEAGSIGPTVIVAIDNLDNERFLQYMPQTIYDRAGQGVRFTVEQEITRVGATSLASAQFIQFLEKELKPFIDRNYRTSRDRLDTAIFGASMAGVMSGAILVEAQQSFGRGACMSPNWPIYDKRMIDHPELPSIWSDYFAQVGAPEGRRLWLDHGTQMMDAGMEPHQAAIADALVNLGWRRGCNLQTRIYEGGHAFAQTATQMDEVLAWLLA